MSQLHVQEAGLLFTCSSNRLDREKANMNVINMFLQRVKSGILQFVELSFEVTQNKTSQNMYENRAVLYSKARSPQGYLREGSFQLNKVKKQLS